MKLTTVAGLVVRAGGVGSPRLDPPAAALTPLVVPHRVFPQLTHGLELRKLPGRTFTVAGPGIKSPFFQGSVGSVVFFNYFAQTENIMWAVRVVGWTGPLAVTNMATITLQI